MDRFLSHFTNRFDAKGRVSIPAPFRQVLAKDGFEGVYAYPSLDQPALDCGGLKLLAEIDALLATMPHWSPARARPRCSARARSCGWTRRAACRSTSA